MSVLKNILLMKIEMLEKLNKTELMLLSNWTFIKNKEINSISNY